MTLMRLSGYPATWNAYPVNGGPRQGGWMEQIDQAAAQEAIAKTPRPPLKIGDAVIWEADLSTDEHGIKMDALINVGHEFQVKGQQWSASDDVYMAKRIITAIEFKSFSISGTPKAPVSNQEQVEAGAAALKAAFPTLANDFTDAWFEKAAKIVLQAKIVQQAAASEAERS